MKLCLIIPFWKTENDLIKMKPERWANRLPIALNGGRIRGRQKEKGMRDSRGNKETFEMMDIFIILIVVIVSQIHMYVKVYQIIFILNM